MNSFRLIDTIVVKSVMDFTRAKKDSVFKGALDLSTVTKTPKDANRNKYVYCTVILSIGKETDNLKIQMETLSKFEIMESSDPDTLREDSASYCSDRAVKAAYKKFEELTETHLGKPIQIPLPSDME